MGKGSPAKHTARSEVACRGDREPVGAEIEAASAAVDGGRVIEVAGVAVGDGVQVVVG